MKRYEKEEIETLPEKYRPLGAWKYFGLTILFSIPIIGWIFLIVFALSGNNINRRSFARSYFCGIFIVLIILAVVLLGSLAFGGLEPIMDYIRQIVGQPQA